MFTFWNIEHLSGRNFLASSSDLTKFANISFGEDRACSNNVSGLTPMLFGHGLVYYTSWRWIFDDFEYGNTHGSPKVAKLMPTDSPKKSWICCHEQQLLSQYCKKWPSDYRWCDEVLWWSVKKMENKSILVYIQDDWVWTGMWALVSHRLCWRVVCPRNSCSISQWLKCS